MAQRVELSAENREELAYKLICWMEKRGLWEYTPPLFQGNLLQLRHYIGAGPAGGVGRMYGRRPLKGVH